jgi:hypothetical protein
MGGTMPLEEQILAARREIKPDGYDMSVGEIMNLYRDKELIINPAYRGNMGTFTTFL